MTTDTELLLRLAAQRAGFTESQLDALRRRDYATLLAERAAAPPQPDPFDDPHAGTTDAAYLGASGATVAPDQDAARSARLEADLARVSQRLAVVRTQRDAALRLLRQLADRLGCCPQCWGTDATCGTCGGRGSPGHFPTDPGLLDWLAPALAASDAARPPTDDASRARSAPTAPAAPISPT
ncbi:hypothetical protein [Cellulomonas carbonis]|uniref:Uncharacterized protein n=1 Tax=Cellulomonas carbonis T26 TaxID=947969 RepID=A0A0A0BT26_9CELL|nr:hypothetical protein [Cellulomonas carbonis]KGM10279.1 hypothetical protein N868_15890 [Cellulomonas carbonis T26]GGC05774.1 hypothetical protein GCM10010972_18720 [Cellulomonas carbonis]